MMIPQPGEKPGRPHFSSGPCAKRPGWTPGSLSDATLGRSHRSAPGLSKLRAAVDLTRDLLEIPRTHAIAIVPGSDTGAVEMAMWSLLGARGCDVLAWESFGKDWVADVIEQLKLPDARTILAPYGELPDLEKIDFSRDVVFTWNGTTSGVRVPSGDFIPAAREGLTICDATSAVFAQAIDWAKLDVATFSWQKALGGEAAHGMLVLGPRAIARLETYTPDRPIPKLFRLTQKGKMITGLFEGSTINTPSMLCVEDYLDALRWGMELGGLRALRDRADRSAKIIADWVRSASWVDHLARDPATRSNTSVCLRITDRQMAGADEGATFVKKLTRLLEQEGIAYDIAAYRDAPPGLRIWCGCTVEPEDVARLTSWLDWAYRVVKARDAKAA